MIITANPSTLVEFAQRADRDKESLIRDIHDGSLSCDLPPEAAADARAADFAPQAGAGPRAGSPRLRSHGELLPKHAWPELSVLAVWTGGSVNMYLSHLPALYGETAIRDHGLSASEGRMTIPLADGTSAGMLDFYHHYFEFIPVEEHDQAPAEHPGRPRAGSRQGLLHPAHDLRRTVSLRHSRRGPLRRLRGPGPLVEFLNKGKHFCSLTGEKLSEYQVMRAVKASFASCNFRSIRSRSHQSWTDHPRYVLLVEPRRHRGRADELAHRVQVNLERVNEEYGSKCTSGRLLPVQIREVAPGTWTPCATRIGERGNFEEYKHPCLVGDLGFVDRLITLPRTPK